MRTKIKAVRSRVTVDTRVGHASTATNKARMGQHGQDAHSSSAPRARSKVVRGHASAVTRESDAHTTPTVPASGHSRPVRRTSDAAAGPDIAERGQPCDERRDIQAPSAPNQPVSGLCSAEIQPRAAATGQSTPASCQEDEAAPSPDATAGTNNDGIGQSRCGTLTCDADPSLAYLRVLVRQRYALMDQTRRTTLAAKAYARLTLGWRKDHPDAKDLAAKASKWVDDAFKDKPIDAPAVLVKMLEVYRRSLEPIHELRTAIERELKPIVRALPVWAWCEGERGIGEVLLASLINELVDPGQYANPAKVWKRMGLSVTNAGEESALSPIGSAMKNPNAGYSPRRRSVAFLIGDGFIKAGHPMRASVYDVRKAYTIENRPEWKKPIRYHRDAHRVMVKRWLVEFWKRWRFGDAFIQGHNPQQQEPAYAVA